MDRCLADVAACDLTVVIVVREFLRELVRGAGAVLGTLAVTAAADPLPAPDAVSRSGFSAKTSAMRPFPNSASA